MNRGGWLLLIGSAALAAAVAAMATRESARSPEEELLGIRDRLERGRIDREEALYDLDHLVAQTIEAGDPAFVARLRLTRARLLMEIAAWDRAREDLRVALGLGALSPAEQLEVEDDLIDLHVRAEDYENGLNLVKVLLDRDPRDASAWMRFGDLHLKKAQIPLERARELIASRLVADDAMKAGAALEQLAAMDPTDPLRPSAGHALASHFEIGEEDRAQRVLRLADDAARENAQAREAYATSLAVRDPRADPGRALGSLVDLLRQAGRLEDAAELATCGLRMMRARGDEEALGTLVDVLEELGRTNYACEVGRWLIAGKRPAGPRRLLRLIDLYYRAERWPDLASAAGLLMQVGTASENAQASFYGALAQVRQGTPAGAISALQGFIRSGTPEPFEGARAQAWRHIALGARRMRAIDLEREALESAIELDLESSGEEMLRLSALLSSSGHGGYRRAEVEMARAMSALPERTEELLPTWRKLGARELEAAGMSASDVLTDPTWRRVFAGASDASVYELHVLSSMLLYKGQAGRAEPYVRQINQLLPTFVPGLDLAIHTMRKLRRREDLLDFLLLRTTLAGTDERTRVILAEFAPATLPVGRRIAFMRSDPEGFGRREIARGMVESGRPEVALALIAEGLAEGLANGPASGPAANELPEDCEIAAAAWLALGRPEDAFGWLEPLGRRATATPAALDLYVRAAVLSGHDQELARRTARAARTLLPRRKSWLRLADELLSRGAVQAAEPFVRRLDADPRLRGGDVLLRLSFVQLLRGDRAGLAKALERAQAFDTQGRTQIAGVLACGGKPGWPGLDAAIDRLKDAGWQPTRLQRAALLALEGDSKAARAVIGAALEKRPDDPVWLLAAALSTPDAPEHLELPASFGDDAGAELVRFLTSEVVTDPRFAWCLLIAIEDPIAEGYAEARLRPRRLGTADDAPGRELGLWDLWLLARLARTRGDLPTERTELETLLSRFAGFGPAWDRLEDVARALRTPPEGIAALRERRLHAMGTRSGTEAEIALDVARIQRRDGDLEGALASAEKAALLLPESPEARLELGLVRAERGEWKEAVAALVEASRGEASGSDLETSGAMIRALEAAGEGEPPALSVEERMSELEALQRRVPHDPRVPVALARMELERDPRNPAFSVPLGVSRLQRFLAQHKGIALENLCAGSVELWTDLLLEIDPGRARTILERELERDPNAIETWIQLGRVRAVRGEAEREEEGEDMDEKDELELVRRMAPLPAVLRAHARVRLAGAPKFKDILEITRTVPTAEGREGPDPELTLLLARAYFGLGPPGLAPALALLEGLAIASDVPDEIATEAKLLLGEALVAKGDGNRAARVLAEVRGKIADPYRATIALACASLAERIGQN